MTRQYVPTTVQPCPAEVYDEHNEDGKFLNHGYPSSVIVHDKSPTISKWTSWLRYLIMTEKNVPGTALQ
jgi:hypothetical protein